VVLGTGFGLHVGGILYEKGSHAPQKAGLGRDPGMKKKFAGGILLITAIFILFIQIPVTEAYASSSAETTSTGRGGSRPTKGIPNVVLLSGTTIALKPVPGSTLNSDSGIDVSEPASTGDDDTTDTNGSADSVSSQSNQVLGSTHIVGNRAVLFLDNNDMVVNQGGRIDSFSENTTGSQIGIQDNALPKFTQVEYLGNKLIADQSFYQNDQLTEVNIPSGITEIGQFAYARSSVTKLYVPEGTKTIGYGAFYHCDSLTEVTLPSTIQSVEPMAFTHTGWMDQFLTSGTDDYLLSGGVLLAYKGNASQITLPNQVKVIAADVFKGHEELQSVTLPYGLEVVGEGAFEGCTSLTTITGGENLTQIKDRAFKDCPLTYIAIPASVNHIGLGAYDFTNTQKGSAQKTVVFAGITLPALSYEASAGRLSNRCYRTEPLGDVKFAVIDPNTSENHLKDTVLFDSDFPFMGIIGSITGDGFFQCRFTYINQHEFDPSALPGTVQIGDASYPITGVDTMEYLPWVGNADQEAGTVLFIGIEGANASLSASRESLILQAALPTDITSMKSAYQRVYQTNLPENTVVYDMTLMESTSSVPITKLDTQEMLVTIPVPESLMGQDIRVFTLDRNGQLEIINSKIQTLNDKTQLTFMTNHFSLFAFCGK
jgi:hypothetical protein